MPPLLRPRLPRSLALRLNRHSTPTLLVLLVLSVFGTMSCFSVAYYLLSLFDGRVDRPHSHSLDDAQAQAPSVPHFPSLFNPFHQHSSGPPKPPPPPANTNTNPDPTYIPVGLSTLPSLSPSPSPSESESFPTLDPQTKYLSFLPHSGFHNQRIALENALLLSKLLNRTLILPPARLGSKPSTYRKFDILLGINRHESKDGLGHCPDALRRAGKGGGGLPEECGDYFGWTFIGWDWLVDMTGMNGGGKAGDGRRRTVFEEWGIEWVQWPSLYYPWLDDLKPDASLYPNNTPLPYPALPPPAPPSLSPSPDAEGKQGEEKEKEEEPIIAGWLDAAKSTFILKDSSSYQFQLLDYPLSAVSPTRPSKYRVNLPIAFFSHSPASGEEEGEKEGEEGEGGEGGELEEMLKHAADAHILQLGTMFGSGRIHLKEPGWKELRDQIKRAMVFRNQYLVRAAEEIVGRIFDEYISTSPAEGEVKGEEEKKGTHGFMGAHVRLGDGVFMTEAENTARTIWYGLLVREMGYSFSEAVELESHFRALIPIAPSDPNPEEKAEKKKVDKYEEADVPKYRKPGPPPARAPFSAHFASQISSSSSVSVSGGGKCRRPPHTDPQLAAFNLPLYISTDSASPSLDPNLALILHTFPCTLFLSDFLSPPPSSTLR